MARKEETQSTKKPVNTGNDRPFTKSQFMFDLKKASRRLTDSLSDRKPLKSDSSK